MFTTRFLRNGSQVIATIDIVISVLSFISVFFLVFLTMSHGDLVEAVVVKNAEEFPELAALFALGREICILVLLGMMGIYVFYFFLGRYLLYGVQDRSHRKIRRWCTISLVTVFLRVAFFLTAVFFVPLPQTLFLSSFGVVGFLYQVSSLWFLRLFQQRLEEEEKDFKLQFIAQDLQQNPYLNNAEFHNFRPLIEGNGTFMPMKTHNSYYHEKRGDIPWPPDSLI